MLTFSEIKKVKPDYSLLAEIFVSYFYHKFVKKGDVVIDGGANHGFHFYQLAELVGSEGFVYGFEANSALCQFVEDRGKALGLDLSHTKMINMAISDTQKPIEFIIYPENLGLSHIVHEGPIHQNAIGLASKKVVVECGILDDYVKQKVSFIKSDLEGADFSALRGAKKLLKTSKPLIIFEFAREKACRMFGYTRHDFFAFFNELDYLIIDVHGRPLSLDTWHDRTMGYEYIAIPKSYDRLSEICLETLRFWESALTWDPIPNWEICSLYGKNPPSLVKI